MECDPHRAQTVQELLHAFDVVRDDTSIGAVILTGQGDWAFCSGGDQMIRGDDGYIGDPTPATAADGARLFDGAVQAFCEALAEIAAFDPRAHR